ncbi:osteoclast-stimulating factor 1-like [Dysidea avara]|uniref:osteoclast-stimulating factor 1-like n=1 Tax=Dysidea avara TaxID=196820 RepID=UPI00331F6B14
MFKKKNKSKKEKEVAAAVAPTQQPATQQNTSKPRGPNPPPPKPKPGKVQVYRAVYAYTAQQPDELSFEEGENIYVLEQSDIGWWKAKVGTKTGLIPCNYVEQGGAETIDNPLHEAAKRGNVGFLNECLANQVSVNGLDKSGSTPLHWAASGGHAECAKILLAVPNIELDVQNKLGDTALHNAAWKGHVAIVEMLLEKGCKMNLLNNEKQTPYDLAAKSPECGRLLMQHSTTADDEYGDDEDSD